MRGRRLLWALAAVAAVACGDGGNGRGAAAPAATSASSTAPSTTSSSTSTTASTTSPAAPLVAGAETFPIPSRQHLLGRITYAQTPPVGGDHNQVWQNCGYYSRPVEPEFAVHSLEHGAVWVTYRPDLPTHEIDILRQLARSRSHILVSPWRDDSLPAPVVASAWGVQLKLPAATSPALTEFVQAYAGGAQAPEPGGPCTGAFGTPE